MRVRDATEADAAACAAVYAPYVQHTAITFELDPPSAAEMAARIAAAHVWLVADDGDEVLGYAYAGPFKTRPAYRWTTEVSVYLDERVRGRGVGHALYTALIERLQDRGYRMLVAVIALPNEPSERLHRAFGFEPAGILRRAGWKHGAWRDIATWQRAIGDGIDPPPTPR